MHSEIEPNMTRRRQPQHATDLLKRIVAECQHPARLVELYYWSAEPKLTDVMRQYIALPDDVRAVLHAFFMLVGDDPKSVAFRITRDGKLILSSSAAAKLAKRMPNSEVRYPAVH